MFIFEIILFYNFSCCFVVNIVFGLFGVILIMIMILFISVVIVCECEWGNLEFLIIIFVYFIELMIGKIVLYIFVGLI